MGQHDYGMFFRITIRCLAATKFQEEPEKEKPPQVTLAAALWLSSFPSSELAQAFAAIDAVQVLKSNFQTIDERQFAFS